VLHARARRSGRTVDLQPAGPPEVRAGRGILRVLERFDTGRAFLGAEKKGRVMAHAALTNNPRQRPTLPHSYPCSTIGGNRLNFRVRNGNGCDPAPMTTGKLVPGVPAFAPD